MVLNRQLPMPCLFYPAVKAMGHTVEETLRCPDIQAEILTRIGQEYAVGAVVRMTELWCEAAAFGMDYEITDRDFPHLGSPLCEEAEELEALTVPDPDNPVTGPLIEAVRLAAPGMTKPLIVGVTGPYTMGSVLNGSEDFMMNCMTEADSCHAFLEKATDFLIRYIGAYKEAGASAVMIAEPSVAMISPDMVREFSNAYLQKIADALQEPDFPLIYHNCGAVNPHLDAIAELPFAAFHFGSDVDLALARKKLPADRILMGNLEPTLFLSASPEKIGALTTALKARGEALENYILSTGCDLSPAASLAGIEAFLEAANA